MAENVQWILQQEQRNGHEKIFVTGHNSHVAKWGSSDSMGKLLSKDAANGYYVIGTDFYKTHCNMPTRSPEKRTIQVFYSHDPLAKAAKLAGFDIVGWILLKSRKILNWVGRLLNTPIWEHLEKATQSLCDFFLQVIECFNLLRCFMIV